MMTGLLHQCRHGGNTFTLITLITQYSLFTNGSVIEHPVCSAK